MITPTKGIAPDRALLAVGAQVIQVLEHPLTVSQAWIRLKEWRVGNDHPAPISFGWFVLALDALHALGLLDLKDDLLTRRSVDAAPAER
ncbi:ABC-three component system middle component 6 [Streptomyces xiamenensis]|uniref:ABC-three component system middle component 6 n=1 Tax=Streptomyces xiamenensis TaxID=408015 RepID=UPI0036C8DDC7